MLSSYSPGRVLKAFRLLLTVFVIMRRRPSFFGLPPLGPEGLKQHVLDLGVCFIKLAQVLATRADFFPDDYLAQLKTIHDQVAPMDEAELRAALQLAYPEGPPFTEFDPAPIASASIGQVHRAVAPGGETVAVKLRRLRIEERIHDDLLLLGLFLKVFRPLFNRYTRNSLESVILEFSAMLRREANLSMELDNLEKFRRTYKHSGVIFPKPYPELSNVEVLVMSFEPGYRVDDQETLRSLDIPFKDFLNRLVSFYTEQMLVRGFFHCDPHPGNLLIREDGSLVLLDFGMVKRLPKETRLGMIELAKSAHERDYDMYVRACRRLGVVASEAPSGLIIEFAERMFDILGNENLSAASMQALIFEVLDSMKELPFKLPQEVVYVMRVSALIEGLGAAHIENFNGVKDILPELQKNLGRALGAEAGLFPTMTQEVKDIPLTIRRLKTTLADLSDGSLQVRLSPDSVDLFLNALRRRLAPYLVCAAFAAAAFLAALLDFPGHEATAAGLFLFACLRLFLALK
ncbi:MAG: ubiquinone biosynthesis protein [Desulfovibrionales bacterium]|nr:ubiquinone biosynthesis protein [Desulfovibrionales bacterium]